MWFTTRRVVVDAIRSTLSRKKYFNLLKNIYSLFETAENVREWNNKYESQFKLEYLNNGFVNVRFSWNRYRLHDIRALNFHSKRKKENKIKMAKQKNKLNIGAYAICEISLFFSAPNFRCGAFRNIIQFKSFFCIFYENLPTYFEMSLIIFIRLKENLHFHSFRLCASECRQWGRARHRRQPLQQATHRPQSGTNCFNVTHIPHLRYTQFHWTIKW